MDVWMDVMGWMDGRVMRDEMNEKEKERKMKKREM